MKIGKELALITKKKGVYQEWFDQMRVLGDKNRLLGMYAREVDFYLSNDSPTNNYICRNFVDRMEECGVHLDESLNMANDRRATALGRCIGWVEIDNFDVSEIFVKHESDPIITAKGNSFVMIDMFSDSKLHVIASADSRVCVNHYSSTLKTESSEKAVTKVIEKCKKTY